MNGGEPCSYIFVFTVQPGSKRIVQLLASCREACLHDSKETIALPRWKRRLVMDVDTQDSRVYLRCWIKRSRGNVRNNVRVPVKLDTHSQQAQITRACNDTLSHLLLYHHHYETRRIGTFQEMAKRGSRDIVGQIGYEFIRFFPENFSWVEK